MGTQRSINPLDHLIVGVDKALFGQPRFAKERLHKRRGGNAE